MLQGQDADLLLSLSGPHETDASVDFREKGVIATHSDVGSRKKNTASLTHENAARCYDLASELFYAESLGSAVASVT